MPRSLSAAPLLALIVFTRVGATQQPQITIHDAIERALAVQPAVVQARGAVTSAEWQKRAAYGAFLPSLSVSSSAFRQNSPSIVNGLSTGQGLYEYSTSL